MDNNQDVQTVRLSEKWDCLIDNKGNRIKFDDPRVTHIWVVDTSPYTSVLIASCFKKRGWNYRISAETTAETLQLSRQLGSGRECLPSAAIAGATLKDILQNRRPDEISVYYNLDQDGPCQNGAWTVLWEAYKKRIDLSNVAFLAWPNIKTNYMGQGEKYAIELGTAAVLGDLLDEAELVLKCVASDKKQAMETMEIEAKRVLDSHAKGFIAIEKALKRWAFVMAMVPLKQKVEETAKVLLFGGLNLLFVHYPITDYFVEQGVIPKLVDFSEGLVWLESEEASKYGFERGLIQPKDQFNVKSLLLSGLNPKNNKKKWIKALKSRAHVFGIDLFLNRYRKIMEKSGLLFDKHIPFVELAEEGSKFVSHNGFLETPITTGRYLNSVKYGIFDGLVNVGSFNCQPAMNSQAVLRPLANTSDIPYTALDCEGPWISANQKRLLETIAVGAKRLREEKNQSLRC